MLVPIAVFTTTYIYFLFGSEIYFVTGLAFLPDLKKSVDILVIGSG